MSPRSSLITVLLAAVLLTAPCRAAAGEADHGGSLLIRLYQEHLSPADGGRCPMTPSCSEYARQAIQKHGPVVGWIMACDRLMRCGRDEVRLSPAKIINGQSYTHDPVAANDFWWFLPRSHQKGLKSNPEKRP